MGKTIIDKHLENFQEKDDKTHVCAHKHRSKIRFNKMKQKALAQ